MGRLTRVTAFLVAGLVAGSALAPGAAVAPYAALAHDERDPVFPDGSYHVPAYRTDGPRLLVCKDDRADFDGRVAAFPAPLRERNLALWEECQRTGYRHLQQAVDQVRSPGMTILVLPGVYREEPSLAPPSGTCAALDAPVAGRERHQVLSWQQQVSCPHNQNLVAVLGKKDLQIEGTGAAATDVVVDAQYQRLNAIRADRADGFYLRNLTAQRTTFNGVYVLETDGFVIDGAVGRWNDEYGFLTFADDHGLYTDCEAYGNGDSGIYPGAASNINAGRGHVVERYAVEVRRCYSHHNALGYSGTAGDSVWAHDNVFTENGTGVATDSAYPNHPGMPQNHARFERNVIADNNVDYYRYMRDGTCARPYAERGYENGVVCPTVGIPTGTGVINPGGNYNIWRDNWVYGNSFAGFLTAWVPGFVRNDTSLPAQFDTSHHNLYLDNVLGVDRSGEPRPNRMDFWWDGQGVGSCWQAPAVSEPYVLPRCGADDRPAGVGVHRYVAEPGKTLKLYVCADYSRDSREIPSNCDWYGARGLERIEVQYALGEALLLGLVLLALWLRLLRRSVLAALGTLTALAGLAVGVLGTEREAGPLTPVGLAALGVGLVLFGAAAVSVGRRVPDRDAPVRLRAAPGGDVSGGLAGGPGAHRRTHRPAGLGWLTLAVGVFALLGAVDRGLVMLPWIPVPPSLPRILLELVWVPWALVALVRGAPLRRPALAPAPAVPARGRAVPATAELADSPGPAPVVAPASQSRRETLEDDLE